MEEVFKNLGLSDGFNIPVASDENKALEQEIQNKIKEKEQLTCKAEDTSDRLINLKKFAANIQNEVTQNLALLSAYDNQIHSEDADARLSRSQVRNNEAEEKQLSKHMSELNEKEKNLENENSRTLQKIEELKAYLHWDRSALQAWQEEVARGSEDAAVLEYFTKQDRAKFNELELRRLAVREEVQIKRTKMDNLRDDVISLEQVLEKTGVVFQRQHEDRKALVSQWEGSVRILRQRDEEINRAIEEVGGLKMQSKQRMRDLAELKRFHENEVRNGKELEIDLKHINKEAITTKDLAVQLTNAIAEMEGQCKVLRGAVSSTANIIHDHRWKCRKMQEEILKKKRQSGKLEARLMALGDEIQKTRGMNPSAADRVQQLEDLKRDETRIRERFTTDRMKLQEVTRSVTEEIIRLKNKEKEQKTTMGGLEGSLYHVKKKISASLQEQKRQGDILYAAEIDWMEKDIRYRRMFGSFDPEKKAEKERREADLERIVAECRSAQDLLTNELYRIDQEYRRLVPAVNFNEKELDYLRSKKQDHILWSEGGGKQLQQLRSKNQERQVDDNMLKLRVKQIEQAVNKVGGKLFSLEKQRLELDEAVKERSLEVRALMDVLNVQKRGMMEQVSSLNAKINIARVKVDHLRKKYEVNISSFGTDDSGELQSVNYYKIKAAQERCELQHEGDRLDERIKKTEKEIEAMENTLKVVGTANKKYKYSLSNVDAEGPEMEEKENLEKVYLEAMEALRQKKTTLQTLNEAATRLEDQLSVQAETEAKVLKEWKEKDFEASDLGKELLEQEEKLNRAAKVLKGFVRNVRSAQHTRFQTLDEKDIELREILEQNQIALQQLSEIVIRKVDTAPTVTRYLEEKGLALPQLHSCRLSSSRLSTTSSRSSGSLHSRFSLAIDSSALDDTDNLRKSSHFRSERKSGKSFRSDKTAPIVDVVDVVFDCGK